MKENDSPVSLSLSQMMDEAFQKDAADTREAVNGVVVSAATERRLWTPKQGVFEVDPHGKDAHAAGAKLDAGKNRLGLVLLAFSRALQEVGKVGTYGANKYSDNGWIEVPNGEARYTDAMLRHLFKEAAGEENDKDTGIAHAAHCAWNSLARLDLMLRRMEQQRG